jgi:hypothetical protein
VVDDTIARKFFFSFLTRLRALTALAATRPPAMPSCLPTPAKVDFFLPADAGRPGTLLAVVSGQREDLDPTRWRVRRYRGELFPAALGLIVPGRWPTATLPRVFKNVQLVDMAPIDERAVKTAVLLADGCRFAEEAPRREAEVVIDRKRSMVPVSLMARAR